MTSRKPEKTTSTDIPAAKVRLKMYYRLTKPGIIYGNLITAVGGFLFAAQGRIDIVLLAATALGVSLIIASACVFNNYLDRHIDAKMIRTQKRALVSGGISPVSALVFGTILGLLGVLTLYLFVNVITLVLGLIGWSSYVWAYTFLKRMTVHGTLVGSIPGATPIAAGYTAVTGQFDMGAAILFLIMFIWQMPHFYAISIFRKTDYSAANIPVHSIVRGTAATKKQILLYIYALVFAVFALWAYGFAGYAYLVITIGFVAYWLYKGLMGLKQDVSDETWARKMFGLSLVFLLIFSAMLALDAWLA